MATCGTFSSVATNAGGNATNFNAWAGGISTLLNSLTNWTKQSDGGAINFSTNTSYPVGTNSKIGYDIWALTDGNQGSYPIFMRLDYGSGAATNNPAIWVTLGTGWSAGSPGVISGTFLTAMQFTVTASASSYTSYICTNAGLMFSLWNSSGLSTYRLLLVLERTHTGAGAINGNGMLLASIVATAFQFQYLNVTGSSGTLYSNMGIATPPVGNGVSGSYTYGYLVRGWNPNETEPLWNLVGYVPGDFASGTPSSYSLTCFDNVSRSYEATAQLTSIAVGYGQATNSLLFLYQ